MHQIEGFGRFTLRPPELVLNVLVLVNILSLLTQSDAPGETCREITLPRKSSASPIRRLPAKIVTRYHKITQIGTIHLLNVTKRDHNG